MAVALEELVKELADSGVIAPGKLENFVPPKAQPSDPEELLRELVKQNHLSKFQAEQILAGKARWLILGNYTLLDKIGAGGMGQVFKAHHRRMDRTVAIKLLPEAVNNDRVAVARFHREVQAAAKLSHPNIVTAHDADESGGVHFLVMEYIAGSDLSALVKKNGPLPVEKAVDYVLQAARGLEYAHKKGVIHRDIKPANLLLDAEGMVKILDMGLARINASGTDGTQAELTGSGAVMGTVDYMAPEQAMNTHDADARADIYSLGCTLYYLLTGKAIYDGDTLMAKMWAHREESIPALSDVRSDVPQAIEDVMRKMVAKTVGDRYQSMSEVIAELQNPAVAAIEQGGSSRATTQPHLRAGAPRAGFPTQAKVSSKKMMWIAAAAACLVVGVVGFIFGTARNERIPDAGNNSGSAEPRADKNAAPGGPPLAESPFNDAEARQHQDAWAAYLGTRVEIANTLGMQFRLIPPGRFQMGSTQGDANEQPVHQVTISTPYFIGMYEVLQTEYEAVMGDNPSKYSGERLPVEGITSVDAITFCQKLSERDGSVYRLPTEAEWEFACRAGTTTLWCFGDDPAAGVDYFWCKGNGENTTHPVGEKRSNAFGLFDMHGNVCEYCADFTGPYTAAAATDPRGPKFGDYRGFRGGSWFFPSSYSRSADRQDKQWPLRGTHVGFRVVREVAPSIGKSSSAADAKHDWLSRVAALPAQEQIDEVSRKLIELNPGFDGRLTGYDGQGAPRIEQDVVTEIGFDSEHVADLSPVRALVGLQALNCSSRFGTKAGKVYDLSPLHGLKLISLSCCDTQVADLTPVKQMPLTTLICYHSRVSDLSPLAGLRLKLLWIGATETASLQPLQGMPLESLAFNSTQVTDITPIEGMPLTFICLTPHKITQGVDALRQMTTLIKIEIDGGQNWKPADFWNKYDAGDFGPVDR